jgi:hypothetical protein
MITRAFSISLLAFALAVAPRGAQAQRKPPYEPPYRPPPTAWWRQEQIRALPRWWLAPGYARLPSEGLGFLAVSAGAGVESQVRSPSALVRWLYGSSFGVELRGHLLRPGDGAPAPWLAAGGLALTMNVVEHDVRGLRRVRFPSLCGLVLPEAGIAARSPQPTSLYFRWSAPVALLVDDEVAVELVPSVSLLNEGAHGDVEALWLLGVGISWRALGHVARRL